MRRVRLLDLGIAVLFSLHAWADKLDKAKDGKHAVAPSKENHQERHKGDDGRDSHQEAYSRGYQYSSAPA